MEAGARIIAVIGFGLCAALLVAQVGLLTAKRFPRRFADQPNRRASAVSVVCLSLGLCIITGTIATGWSVSDPQATLGFGGPAVLGSFLLSFYFRGKAQRGSLDLGSGRASRLKCGNRSMQVGLTRP
jgi:hypothetical protein